MEKQQKNALRRKAEKLIRLAYDLESDAAALRYMGAYSEANGVAAMASDSGKIGRAILDRLGL